MVIRCGKAILHKKDWVQYQYITSTRPAVLPACTGNELKLDQTAAKAASDVQGQQQVYKGVSKGRFARSEAHCSVQG